VYQKFCVSKPNGDHWNEKQGCQIFLGTKKQNGKNININQKIYQKATKYNK
jgi:hypothetical protein